MLLACPSPLSLSLSLPSLCLTLPSRRCHLITASLSKTSSPASGRTHAPAILAALADAAMQLQAAALVVVRPSPRRIRAGLRQPRPFHSILHSRRPLARRPLQRQLVASWPVVRPAVHDGADMRRTAHRWRRSSRSRLMGSILLSLGLAPRMWTRTAVRWVSLRSRVGVAQARAGTQEHRHTYSTNRATFLSQARSSSRRT